MLPNGTKLLFLVTFVFLFYKLYDRTSLPEHLIRITRPPQSLFEKLTNFFQKAVHPAKDTPLPSPKSVLSPQQTYQTSRIANIDLAHHIPSKPDGIAILFHACTQSAEAWYTFPEHRRLANLLALQNITTLAIGAQNTFTGCFSTRFPPEENEDVQRVLVAVEQFSYENNLDDLPLYAIGVSTGATFASVLSSSKRFNALNQVLYLSLGNQRAFHRATSSYPNTLFVYDQNISPFLVETRERLLSRNVQVVGEMPMRRPVWTADIFHLREPRIHLYTSKALYSEIQRYGNDINLVLQKSRHGHLAPLFQDASLQAAAIQIFRVVKGSHELSSTHAEHVVNWLIHAPNTS